ncbi:MAG: hypothetical protein ACFFBK_07000, partial [Promethearchaeota archaeon]
YGVICTGCSAPFLLEPSKFGDFVCPRCSSNTFNVAYRCDTCQDIYQLTLEQFDEFNRQPTFDCPKCSSKIVLVQQETTDDTANKEQIP